MTANSSLQWVRSLSFSAAGQAVTRRFEGLHLGAYADPGGVLTIGWGHTAGVKAGTSIDQATAEAFFAKDVRDAVAVVRTWVQAPLNQGQFDALVDFVFNVGTGTPGARDGFVWVKTPKPGQPRSALLAAVNRSDGAAVLQEFPKWVHGTDDGKLVVLPGLVARRAAEIALWRGEPPVLV